MSGLLLTGTFSLTQSTIDAVDTSMVQTLSSAVATADRPGTAATQAFTYYIEVDYDINSKVLYKNSSADNTDDAYGLAEINLSHSAYTPKLNLPSVTGVAVSAGLVNATAGSGLTGSGQFPVTLTVNLSSAGVMTSQCLIIGSSVTASVSEDPTKAQVVYWPTIDGTPPVGATTADKLSDPITASELNNEYEATLNAINDNYNNKNMITGWSIIINPIAEQTNNSLSKFAQDNSKAGQTNIFATGQKIVCSGTQEYDVSIDDYLGNSVQIASGTVYGVITQS